MICFKNLNKVRVIVARCHVDARSDQIRVDSCLGAYISLPPLLSAYFNLPPPSIFDFALSFEACHKIARFFANLTTKLYLQMLPTKTASLRIQTNKDYTNRCTIIIFANNNSTYLFLQKVVKKFCTNLIFSFRLS